MELLYKLLSELLPEKGQLRILLLVLLLVAFYPFHLLTCYMADKGFYAYEMFSSIFGIVVPFLFMAFVFAIVLPLFMVIFWGAILIVLGKLLRSTFSKEPRQPPQATGDTEGANPAALPVTLKQALKDAMGIIVINLIMLSLFGYVLYSTEVEGAAKPLLVTIFASLILGLVLVVVSVTPPAARRSIYALLFLVGLSAPLVGHEHATRLVETTLTQFRLGGIMVTIVSNDGGQDTDPAKANRLYGRLVFLSSSNLYLETGCPRKLVIVPRKDSLRLEFAEIWTAGLKEFRCPDAQKTS